MMRSFIYATLIFASLPAYANSPNAAAVLKECATDPGAPTGVCEAYMSGMIAGILVDQVNSESGRPICLPAKINTDEAILAVVKFIIAHREFWTKDGNTVVGVALQQAYPCR